MSGRSWHVCECKGQQEHTTFFDHGASRCRRRALVELSVKGRNVWFKYCPPCADVIQNSGMTRELERRDLVEHEV